MLFKRLLSTTRVARNNYIYFGNPSLNRLSFLRKDTQFIANAITSPYAKYILFNNLEPIVDTSANQLFKTNYTQLGSLLTREIDSWLDFNKDPLSIGKPSLTVHFMGLDQSNHSPFKYNAYSGVPYFALDITHSKEIQERLAQKYPDLQALITREDVNKHLNNHEASIFAQARMYLDWISTTKFCRGCGSEVIAINAGSELLCTSIPEHSCPVKSAPVSNASFPRLDPVLITCVVNQQNQVLLTRHSKFPQGLYSCIAGFIEPGETIENAVKREVWEEAGLKISKVQIVQSQPWPFPANIMIGSIAYVDQEIGSDTLDLLHDMELQDAKWIDKETLHSIIYEGYENEDLTLIGPGLEFGIANDKTLATQLYKYALDNVL